MNITYSGGTGQQRAWFQEALAHMQYPWDRLNVEITVSWPAEPSLPGHREYACMHSVVDVDHFTVEIRSSLDTTLGGLSPTDGVDAEQVDLHRFYMECVAHEMSHVLHFHKLASADMGVVTSWFRRQVPGEGMVNGTPADLNPLGADPFDRLQEGIAETLKDALLPEQYREFDNRTNWRLNKDRYDEFLDLFFRTSGGSHPIDSNPLRLPYGGPPTERIIDTFIS